MKAANPSQAEAIVLIDEMVRCGVRHACLSPGSRSAPLAMALADDDRIELHVVIDERSASFLALGIAKATRRAVPVVCTSGTAPANLFPAIVEAHHSRTPLLVLTADRPPELRHTGASQTIDQIKMFGDPVRWFCEVGIPEDAPHSNAYWRSTMARAVAVAEGSPAGPVHLNLAFRDPLVPDGTGFGSDLKGRTGGAPWATVATPVRTELDRSALEDLVQRVSGKGGLVVAGAGHHTSPGQKSAVHGLAEQLGWPLLAEAASGLRHGDNTVTAYDACLKVSEWAERHEPEVVLRFGSVTLSKSLARSLRTADQILIEPDGWWLDPDRDIGTLLRMTAEDLAEALRGHVASVPDEWAESWLDADKRAAAAIDSLLDARGMTEPGTARALVRALPARSNLVVSSSMPLRDIEAFAPKRDDVRFLSNRGANGIDGFVSTAIGVAISTPGPTYALCGDLSFLHDQNGLAALRNSRAPVRFIVINNNGGGIFSFLPQARFPERFEQIFGTPHGIDLEKVAAVYELDYVHVTDLAELPAAIDGDDSRVIEVRTERAANVELHREIQQAVEQALS